MDRISAIDNLIRVARTMERAITLNPGTTTASMAMGELELERERVIDAIYAWCDCGKGSICPQYGNEFQHA